MMGYGYRCDLVFYDEKGRQGNLATFHCDDHKLMPGRLSAPEPRVYGYSKKESFVMETFGHKRAKYTNDQQTFANKESFVVETFGHKGAKYTNDKQTFATYVVYKLMPGRLGAPLKPRVYGYSCTISVVSSLPNSLR
jgi:hypothetical protein